MNVTLDKLARAYVLERDGRRCRCCGKDGNEWAHILGRNTAPALRWDPDNAVTLCHGDHDYFTRHPERFRRWVAETLGADHYDMLRRLQTMAERHGGGPGLEFWRRWYGAGSLSGAERDAYAGGDW